MSPLLVLGRTALLPAAISSIAIALISGLDTLAGTLVGGALISSWAFVYAHVMCAAEKTDLQAITRTAAWGACGAPIVVLICLVLGSPAIVLTVITGVLWVAAVTPTGHLPGTPQQAKRITRTNRPNAP